MHNQKLKKFLGHEVPPHTFIDTMMEAEKEGITTEPIGPLSIVDENIILGFGETLTNCQGDLQTDRVEKIGKGQLFSIWGSKI